MYAGNFSSADSCRCRAGTGQPRRGGSSGWAQLPARWALRIARQVSGASINGCVTLQRGWGASAGQVAGQPW